MKLVTYAQGASGRLALLHLGQLHDLQALDARLPATMREFLQRWDECFPLAQAAEQQLLQTEPAGLPLAEAQLLAPVNEPTSCRDGYAFRQHVAAARRNRQVPMLPEFDEYPIFYFTNHRSVQGPGPVRCMPDHFQKLDFELEVAVVVCRQGRNIPATEADDYIGGFMVLNDLSARTLQLEEMLLNLGPAKGKDFCTAIGPWLVTPDELAPYRVPAKPGHTGHAYNLRMTCAVNGQQVSAGNVADMDWTFAELLERCAYGVDLHPGDVIGSGTVGTGCFLELNGTGRLHDPAYQEQWLQAGDVVSMTIEGLGTLTNTIVAEASTHSLLALKKKPAPVG